MVFAHLTRHWMARRHYPFASWAACIARSLRVIGESARIVLSRHVTAPQARARLPANETAGVP